MHSSEISSLLHTSNCVVLVSQAEDKIAAENSFRFQIKVKSKASVVPNMKFPHNDTGPEALLSQSTTASCMYGTARAPTVQSLSRSVRLAG